MNDPLERLSQSVDRMARRATYDERNRLALLLVHGLSALAIGTAIVLDRGPDAWPYPDWTLGVPAIIGGGLLVVGLLGGRRVSVEAVGMGIILCWDAAFVATFARAAATETEAASYPVFVYLCLAGLMGVHLFTLVSYLRGRS